jgi:hypothetical protein
VEFSINEDWWWRSDVTTGRLDGRTLVIVSTEFPEGVAVHGREVNSDERDLSKVCGGGVGVNGLNVSN